MALLHSFNNDGKAKKRRVGTTTAFNKRSCGYGRLYAMGRSICGRNYQQGRSLEPSASIPTCIWATLLFETNSRCCIHSCIGDELCDFVLYRVYLESHTHRSNIKHSFR